MVKADVGAAEDAFVKQEFLELAAVCEEVANEIDDRRASGLPILAASCPGLRWC